MVTRPTVRHLTYSNGCWTVGAEVPHPRVHGSAGSPTQQRYS